MKVELGLGAIRSFKRLSYTPWHALAEFVDNSTQSYFDHRDELDAAYSAAGTTLSVEIDYDPDDGGRILVRDNAMGMSEQELTRALIIGEPPPEPRLRSQYGFGLKTAASWFGNVWTVETKRLGDQTALQVTADVEKVAGGNPTLEVRRIQKDPAEHYTVINIQELNRPLHTRTRSKIRDFLRSMYRHDIRRGILRLTWMNQALSAEEDFVFAEGPTGQKLRNGFAFDVGGKSITGWAGVLARGSRSKAGFSIVHAGRVIRSWPDAWKPQEIYGQVQGSNDLVNQRLVGEIYLDAFTVSHTKDDILWLRDEEQEVEIALKNAILDLITAAKELRRPTAAAPTPTDARKAALALQRSLASAELRDHWLHGRRPPEGELTSRAAGVLARSTRRPPDFAASANGLTMSGYLGAELVPDDEYLVIDSDPRRLVMVININHPFVGGMKADVLIKHVEHCAFEALSRWRATREGDDTSATLTFFKDGLLRIAAIGAAKDSGTE